MKRLIFIFSLVLILNSTVIYSNQVIEEKLNKLADDLFIHCEFKEGRVVKVSNEGIYFNLGKNDGLYCGEKLKIIREDELLKDPVTMVALGKLETKVAQVEVIRIKDKYSLAKIIKSYSKGRIMLGDKIKVGEENIKVGIIDFNYSQISSKVVDLIRDHFKYYLNHDNRFELTSMEKVDKLLNNLNFNKELEKDDLELIGKKADVDLIITGDIYQGRSNIFIHVLLFDRRLDKIVNEEVMTISRDNKLIDYYEVKEKESKFPYVLSFESRLFKYKSNSMVVADVNNDNYVDIILNDGRSLRILNYNGNKFKEVWTIDDCLFTKYDDNQIVVGDFNGNGKDEIIVENFNRLFKFTWDGSSYLKEELNNFDKNRAKERSNIAGKTYLITRDYQHRLKFNLWHQDKYEVDFTIPLKMNEGYRLQLGDVDNDFEDELVLTSYDGEDKYKIKIYTIKGRLKYTFFDSYGADITLADINQDELQEIFLITNNDQKGKVVSFNWNGVSYHKDWESNQIDGIIKDVTAGDIDNDNELELLVLVREDEKSRIYVYQKSQYYRED